MNGNEAGAHLDESDLLRAHMDSGIALAKAGRARFRLALLPHHRDLVVSNHSLAFRSLHRLRGRHVDRRRPRQGNPAPRGASGGV